MQKMIHAVQLNQKESWRRALKMLKFPFLGIRLIAEEERTHLRPVARQTDWMRQMTAPWFARLGRAVEAELRKSEYVGWPNWLLAFFLFASGIDFLS